MRLTLKYSDSPRLMRFAENAQHILHEIQLI